MAKSKGYGFRAREGSFTWARLVERRLRQVDVAMESRGHRCARVLHQFLLLLLVRHLLLLAMHLLLEPGG